MYTTTRVTRDLANPKAVATPAGPLIARPRLRGKHDTINAHPSTQRFCYPIMYASSLSDFSDTFSESSIMSEVSSPLLCAQSPLPRSRYYFDDVIAEFLVSLRRLFKRFIFDVLYLSRSKAVCSKFTVITLIASHQYFHVR